MTLIEVLVWVAILLCLVFNFRKKRDPRYPPGPRPFPIIGNVLQLGSESQTVLRRWAEEYGPAFSMKMGSDNVIVLNDPNLIHDVFQEASSTGREQNPVWDEMSKGHGFLMAEGLQWEELRRFTMRKLKDQGFAKTSMGELISAEANYMVDWFEQRLDKPILGNCIFHGAVINSLWGMVTGERCEWNVVEVPPLIQHTVNSMNALNIMTRKGLFYAPILRFIAPGYFGWTEWVKGQDGLFDIIDEAVESHRKLLDPRNPKDLIDQYLIELNSNRDPGSAFYGKTGEMNLRSILKELFIGGSDTTSMTLSWTLLLLASQPEVQEKLQAEIDLVVEKGRQPQLSDRTKMPYAEAIVREVLRITTVVINGIPHRMIQDAVIQGYFFPKGTIVMGHSYLVNNDPKYWGDPEQFRPERFLSPDGTTLVKHEAFQPFAVGKRQCLGMTVANDTLFVYTTTIFHKFSIRMDPTDSGKAFENIAPKDKFLNHSDPFRIIVTHRIN